MENDLVSKEKMSKNAKAIRDSSIDILRIIFILGVIILYYFSNPVGWLRNVCIGSDSYYAIVF